MFVKYVCLGLVEFANFPHLKIVLPNEILLVENVHIVEKQNIISFIEIEQ